MACYHLFLCSVGNVTIVANEIELLQVDFQRLTVSFREQNEVTISHIDFCIKLMCDQKCITCINLLFLSPL